MRLERSLPLTLIGILILFSLAIFITVIAPNYVDSSWTEPCCSYQTQMYEMADPNTLLSAETIGAPLQVVKRLQEGKMFFAYIESDKMKIVAPKELEPLVTRDKKIILTSKLCLLKPGKEEGMVELYAPEEKEVIATQEGDGDDEHWIAEDFEIVGPPPAWYKEGGVVYFKNPRLFEEKFKGFVSRKDLIAMGENIYKTEGCWYCHTDQCRTLVQDCVLCGTNAYPAPPSSANEYIYQETTFPGTRRIGPDLSRIGIKRPSRAWHMSHFWSPPSKSKGSIMPSFQQFFEGGDPQKPTCRFEAIYQYLMTKGTRITPPNEAWWKGLDKLHCMEILEGKKHEP